MSDVMKHYLITLQLAGPARLHAYLMTANEQDVMLAANKLCDVAEKNHWLTLNIILTTDLGDEPEEVREIFRKADKRIAKTMQRAKNFHWSALMVPMDHPNDKLLMDLH